MATFRSLRDSAPQPTKPSLTTNDDVLEAMAELVRTTRSGSPFVIESNCSAPRFVNHRSGRTTTAQLILSLFSRF